MKNSWLQGASNIHSPLSRQNSNTCLICNQQQLVVGRTSSTKLLSLNKNIEMGILGYIKNYLLTELYDYTVVT